MDKDTFFNYREKGYILRSFEEDLTSLTFLFEYTTKYFTLTEFSLLLSEYLGIEQFYFKPIEVSGINKLFYKITFIK